MAPLATAKPKTATKTASKTAPKAAAPASPPPARMPPPPPPAPMPPPMSAPPAFSPVAGDGLPRNSGKAVAAMVIGIVSCCIGIVPFVGPFLALPAGIIALILGILGVKDVNRDPANVKGKGMAVTGIVLGAIMVVVGTLLLIVFTVGLAALEEYCADNPDTEGCDEINKGANVEASGPLPALAIAARPDPLASWPVGTPRSMLA